MKIINTFKICNGEVMKIIIKNMEVMSEMSVAMQKYDFLIVFHAN